MAAASISHMYQFTLNVDDTFQFEAVFENIVWEDGIELNHNIDVVSQIAAIYV